MVRVASVNVNGVRAAFRKGMQPWLEASGVNVLALQEVRAEREDLEALLGDDWVIAHDAASQKGRAGVAIATKVRHDDVRVNFGPNLSTLPVVGLKSTSRLLRVIRSPLSVAMSTPVKLGLQNKMPSMNSWRS